MFNARNRIDILKQARWVSLQWDKLERKHTKKIKQVLKKQYQDAIDYVMHGVGSDSSGEAVRFHNQELTKVFSAMYMETSEIFHLNIMKNIKSIFKIERKATEARYYSKLNKWIKKQAGERVTDVNKTTKKNIKSIIDRGMNEGLSNAQIASEIKELSEISTPFRAARIARTETHTASMMAEVETLKDEELMSGFKPLKIWSAVMDDRTRETHWDADIRYADDPIPMDEPFEVGDEFLMFPGDPSGSPENIINCLHPDTVINYADLNKITRRFYQGSFITIKTSSGKKITVTPNHPILTIFGWKKACLIKKTDKIVCTNTRISKIFSNFNINDINSSIEQIYNSCNIMPIIMGSSTCKMNFHGDITKESVDVIFANSFLRSRFNSSLSKIFDDFFFINPDFLQGFLFVKSLLDRPLFSSIHYSSGFIGLFRNLLSSFNSQLGHLKRLCFTPVSLNYTNGVKSSYYCHSTYFESIRDFFYRIMSSIQINNRGNDRINLFFPDNITEISHDNDSCYVYNLETKDSVYIANGIVNHNCRCFLTYRTE